MTATQTLILAVTLALNQNQPLQQSQQHGPFTVRVQANTRTVTLSESVLVTLELTGPSPLIVREAEPLLDTPAWSAQALTQPQLTPLADGQERWTRTYRLEPELPGTPNSIELRPVRVRDGVQERQIAWPSLPVTVTTQIPNPHIDQLRPISDIESPADPTATSPTTASSPYRVGVLMGGLVVTVLALSGACVWLFRKRRRGHEPTPAEWAMARLAACPDPVAALAVLRQYLHRRYALPAHAMTANELAQAQSIPSALRARLGPFLLESEAARYAGLALPEDLLVRVRQLIESDTRKIGRVN